MESMSMMESRRNRPLAAPTSIPRRPHRFAVAFCVALACAFAGPLLLTSASALAATNYQYQSQITGFSEPDQIANCGGDVYVSDLESEVVDEYNSSGTYIGHITGAAAGGFDPGAIAVDCSGGHIYVFDSEHKVVDEFGDNFAAAEKYIGKITGAATGSSFGTIRGLGINSHGVIYVVEYTKTVVDEFNDNFATAEDYLGRITGNASEKFGLIDAVAVSSTNNVYVADYEKGTVEEFTEPGSNPSSEPGAYVGEVTGLKTKAKSVSPYLGLAFDGSGNVLVANYSSKVIDIFKPAFGSGEEVVGEITGAEVPGGFGTLLGLAVNASNGDVYVADESHKVVDVFSPEVQPTYKTCAKAAKVDKKYTGKFLDKYCEEPATKAQEEEGKKNKYELTSVALPSTFKGKSATTVLDFYEGATLEYKVECKKDASEGEITGESTGSEVIKYSKCKGKEEPSGTAVACENTAKETITSEPLDSQLVDEGGKVYDRLTGSGAEFAEFKCGSVTYKVSGDALGEVGAEQINTASKSVAITFSPAAHNLSAEIGGTTGYTGGVAGTEAQKEKGAALYIELP